MSKEEKKRYYQPYYKPFGNKVMVNPVVGDNKTEGGILIPDAALPPMQKALVIKVGAGVHGEKPDCKAGDTILIPRGCGVAFPFGKANYRIIKSNDVLAIV